MRTLLAGPLALALLATGCSAEEPDPAPSSSGGEPGSRVVALGEEFLAADVLALGVDLVGSTSTTPDQPGLGIEGEDLSSIAWLSATEPDLEQLAGLRPDVLIAPEYVVDMVGEATLAELGAELVVVSDTATWRDQLTTLAADLDAADRAETLLAEYDGAVATATAQVSACSRSLTFATIYPGESVALWAAGPTAPVDVALEIGVPLAPDPATLELDGAGRAFLSQEQVVDQLSGERLVLLQSALVEGEDESLRQWLANPLTQQVAAVAEDELVELDRLGYPGVVGRTRVVGAVADAAAC